MLPDSYLALTPLFVDMDFLVPLDAEFYALSPRSFSKTDSAFYLQKNANVSSCSISQNCTFRGLPGSYFALTPLAGVLEQNTCNTTSFLCAILLQVAQTYKPLCAIVI